MHKNYKFRFSGGWGWLVCGAAFLAHVLTSGLQLAFGLLYLYVMQFLVKKYDDNEFYQMATGKLFFNLIICMDYE